MLTMEKHIIYTHTGVTQSVFYSKMICLCFIFWFRFFGILRVVVVFFFKENLIYFELTNIFLLIREDHPTSLCDVLNCLQGTKQQ